jgi:hypothetical protein
MRRGPIDKEGFIQDSDYRSVFLVAILSCFKITLKP